LLRASTPFGSAKREDVDGRDKPGHDNINAHDGSPGLAPPIRSLLLAGRRGPVMTVLVSFFARLQRLNPMLMMGRVTIFHVVRINIEILKIYVPFKKRTENSGCSRPLFFVNQS
jgi:hypothetical protein